MKIKGIWLPIVTPFKEEKVDLASYERLVNHYINEGVDGIMPLATTGETPTLTEEEYEMLLEKTMELTSGKVGVFVGLGGNNTKALLNKLKLVEKYKVDGILSVSPYYNRPDQRGIYEHFNRISENTDLDIVLYNIPYRTGRNIENETLFKLAEKKNIIGVKDASGDFNKTIDLLLNRPEGFSVLSGEDAYFYNSLLLGGNGGIMASAHLRTRDFIKVYKDIENNDHKEALKTWRELSKFIPLLFKEPNPTPIKYILEKKGLIDSGEVRLPLVEITDELKKELEFLI
ncbi:MULTISPECIES: 4-hydroxy-tetrahydrodipicolinate synthase [Clostridium]|uniref:4-hydroxy-tetrahydrodipicolinate synthase n=1 Tax=Clostridium cibarium TaxID=2762247 RepID=A0ABR8PT81_9CLOT|nr:MULTISPECIES: 4-hydroxy-tetrahydrodipicolinate synthase [Clostridium]MBD7911385.1 4-hydroxy-tetrahydrodipicolinate synthase [Clostridium cibarium]